MGVGSIGTSCLWTKILQVTRDRSTSRYRIRLYAAAITDNKRLRSTYCIVEANYREPRNIARRLATTAELLVRWDVAIWRFSRWRLSAIFNFIFPIMGSLKIACRTSTSTSYLVVSRDHSPYLLSFWENRIFVDRQTNGQTDGQHRCVKALSREAP